MIKYLENRVWLLGRPHQRLLLIVDDSRTDTGLGILGKGFRAHQLYIGDCFIQKYESFIFKYRFLAASSPRWQMMSRGCNRMWGMQKICSLSICSFPKSLLTLDLVPKWLSEWIWFPALLFTISVIWANYFSFGSISFLINKMGLKISTHHRKIKSGQLYKMLGIVPVIP